jgi:hypothetical protein
LYFLQEARLLHLLYKSGMGVSTLQKTGKLYLESPNMLFALAQVAPSPGTLRQVFFLIQVSAQHHVAYGNEVDFLVGHTYRFEERVRTKNCRQQQGQPNSWVVKDNMEWPAAGQLPLWLIGFLY